MEKTKSRSFRRFLAALLCAAMLLPMLPMPGSAFTTIDIDSLFGGQAEDSTETTAAAEATDAAETTEATESPETTEAPEPEKVLPEIPGCSCGSSDPVLTSHADGCEQKAFYKTYCADHTADQIWEDWSALPENGRDFILQNLSWTDWNKLTALNALLLENNVTATESVTASDGTVVTAQGVPAGASVTLAAPSEEARAAVEACVAARGDDSAKQLFAWDISIRDITGQDWQPGETVRVELEVPGLNLHKYSTVYVVHVDDAGVATQIPAEMVGSGKVAFETDGFSTFAAFTVDFAFAGATFSIPGETSIKLSQVFDQLKMPLYVADVADVTFTDTELVTVAKQEDGDWLLTSLKAFHTDEKLTVTMKDGTVYEIDVTDATYVTISYNNSGNLDGGTLGVVEWYLDDSGSGGYAYTAGGNRAPGWTEDYDIYIDGTGASDKDFEIVLQRYSGASGRTLYVDLHTIWIKGGANLIFRLGASITKDNTDQIIVRQVRGYHDDTYGDEWWFGELFWVENGSLELQVPYTTGVHEGVEMVFDWDSGNNNNPSGNGPKALVSLRPNATAFKANNCVFRNTQEAAIVCRANDLDQFVMTDCSFQSTSKPGGNGAGIYVMANTADTNGSYVDIHRFELNNCTFNNSVGGGYGGAVALHGYVHSGLISGCTFTNCESTGQGGGAIEMAGGMGAVTVQNTTFSGCTSKYRGGAVEIRSTNIKNDSGYERWTRSNDITFSGCTFTDCVSSDSHGGAIAVKGQLNSLTVSDCDFSGCTAGVNGGAISIDGQDLPDAFANSGDANPNWAAAIDCSTCTAYGTTKGGSYDWVNKQESAKKVDKKSWVGTVTISNNSTFTNCSCASNGGTIEFASGCYISESATISNSTITGGKAVGGGSGIFLSNCFVKKLNLHDDVFQDCTFTGGASDVGGTVRTTGNTTVVLDVQRCQFLRNYSYGHAGGLYWNAARAMEGVTCAATVNDCLFDGNTADMYGGAIYVESKMTITKCNIRNNYAKVMGGGIAQQVYNNPDVRMLQEGEVSELKLDPQTWIHHNKAGLGGGISIRANETQSIEDGKPIAYTVRFELNGAAVYENNAITEDGEEGHGGGIYFKAESYDDANKQAEVDKFTKVVLINAGTGTNAAVYKNTAAGNGGGIYMESSENTELRVQGGHISGNTANNGGGIYMTGKNATCYVEGGTIGGEGNDSAGVPLANVAKKAADGTGGNGGGIAISGGSTIEMSVAEGQTTGGVISYNQAETDGGGIYLDAKAPDGIANKITVDEGSVIYNTAGNDGGGISMKYRATATLNGGEVSHNTAAANGGGLDVYHYADLTVSGGAIEDNTATGGSGGGVFANWYGKIEIKEGSTIKRNHAAKGKGGGVYALKYNLYITGGEIAENNAADAGGIFISSTPADGYEAIITGGDIYKNTVTNRGGGIFNRGCAKFTVNGGSIYENTAYNGGGIYGDSAGITKVSSGSIHTNTASYRGGGVYLNGSAVVIEGGSVYSNNAPGSGGGICAMTYSAQDENGATVYTGSTVSMSGGSLYKNTANNGWGGGIYMWGVNSSISIYNGSIYENYASGCGGGINAEYYSSVSISGGDIYKNEAGAYGGGLHVYTSTTFTMKGGSIYENTAGEAGGGLSLRDGATALVTNEGETSHGEITRNIAARGGGVSVESGAELTVTNGFITYNKAVGTCALTTALNANTDLKGTGGGIYVASGKSAEDPAKFTLTGTQIAIYANEADFGADDVFANGDNTLLDVPKVSSMNLAGYGLVPDDWFEDYPENDTEYTKGLNGAAGGQGITDGSVWRYRGSDTDKRVAVKIDSTTDALTANAANEYVCMTLGMAAALADSVVVDFGLPVVIDVLANDLVIDAANAQGLYVGPRRPDPEPGKVDKVNDLTGTGFSNTCSFTYGTATVEGNQIKYTLNKMLDTVESFSYAVRYNSVYYFAQVDIIPATSIYYEDGFVTCTVWNVHDDKCNTDPNKQWAPTSGGSSANQNQDRPGRFDTPDPELDADKIYGFDDAYKTMATYSMGSAMKVTLDDSVYAEAQFTFQGTGFDVISLTSNRTSVVMAEVYNADDFATNGYKATPVTYRMVDTYYGYRFLEFYKRTYTFTDGGWEYTDVLITESQMGSSQEEPENPQEGDTYIVYGTDKWEPDPDADNALYQVPILKISGLPYGRYTVVLTAKRPTLSEKTSVDFYLDAIRIYDPANDGAGNDTVQDAYKDDHEGWPEYFELRNLLISRNDFNNLENGTGSGIVFIDNTLDANKNKTYTVADYTNYGPNNEVYLAPGQTIAFGLDVSHAALDKIHLAMKSVGGTVNVTVYDAADTTKTSVTPAAISTATDLYYDITALNGKTVVIRNTGGAILSVTNVKVTYTAAHQDGIEDTFFTTSTQSVEAVMASMLLAEAPGIPGETVPEETVPETTEPEETVPEETIPEETVPEETVPEEPTVFEPERFQVELSGDTVKAGSRIVIGVTTGSDVEHIEINGTVITEYLTNRRTGARTWRVKLIAGTVGQQEIRVVCYNAAGQASEAVTRTVTVTERYTSLNNLLEDVLTNFFGGMVKKWD